MGKRAVFGRKGCGNDSLGLVRRAVLEWKDCEGRALAEDLEGRGWLVRV